MIDNSLIQNDPMIDSSTLLHYNIGALSKLITDVEWKHAQMQALALMLTGKEITEKIEYKDEVMDNETLSDLAVRAVSLDTKLNLQKLLDYLETRENSLKVELAKWKSAKLVRVMEEESRSRWRIFQTKNRIEETKNAIENEQETALLLIIDLLKSCDSILQDTNSTAM